MTRIVLISDTHGLLRPEALAFARGADHIIHAGDIGNASILEQLAAIAPVTAVRGNNDKGAWAEAIADTEFVKIAGVLLYVLHDLQELAIDPPAAGVQAVITGHSHKPIVTRRDSVLYVNPGSAGPRRFRLPVCAGELRVDGGQLEARTVDLLG
jgi:putative phosphoesterase